MKILSFLDKLNTTDYISISNEQLSDLKNHSKLLFEEDTIISGFIRLFAFCESILFQEKTPKGEILVRKFQYKSHADFLIQNRLEMYEKMWDG